MEKPKKILVAYDGSPHSKAALDWAIRLGKDVGAELELVKVFEPIVRQYDVTKIQWTSKIPRSLTHSQLCCNYLGHWWFVIIAAVRSSSVIKQLNVFKDRFFRFLTRLEFAPIQPFRLQLAPE